MSEVGSYLVRFGELYGGLTIGDYCKGKVSW